MNTSSPEHYIDTHGSHDVNGEFENSQLQYYNQFMVMKQPWMSYDSRMFLHVKHKSIDWLSLTQSTIQWYNQMKDTKHYSKIEEQGHMRAGPIIE